MTFSIILLKVLEGSVISFPLFSFSFLSLSSSLSFLLSLFLLPLFCFFLAFHFHALCYFHLFEFPSHQLSSLLSFLQLNIHDYFWVFSVVLPPHLNPCFLMTHGHASFYEKLPVPNPTFIQKPASFETRCNCDPHFHKK